MQAPRSVRMMVRASELPRLSHPLPQESIGEGRFDLFVMAITSGSSRLCDFPPPDSTGCPVGLNGMGEGEIQMHKTTFFVVAAVLFLAGVGAWVATTTQARVIAPIGVKEAIDPMRIMMNAKRLPTEEFADYSFVF
jgi:hypothetical protein